MCDAIHKVKHDTNTKAKCYIRRYQDTNITTTTC